MKLLISLASGALFGIGLVIADMVNPARVQAFLDPFGAWDPTLAFVMGGAIIPMLIAWAFAKGRKPLFAAAFPSLRTEIDRPLVAGSAMFGAGWGLSGFCPGPAIAALSFAGGSGLIFVAAMIAGMGLYRLAPNRSVSA
ncbi:MAG: DUF6691 family protein [Pseudomonadota bacterium]